MLDPFHVAAGLPYLRLSLEGFDGCRLRERCLARLETSAILGYLTLALL